MAGVNTLGNLVQYITGDYTGLSTALNKSESETKKAADNMNSSLQKVGDTFTKVGKGLTIGLTLPIIGLGAAALKSVGQFQLYQASFETMLGSAEKAKVLIGDLQKLAAATPFQFDDLANSGKTLLQFGVELEDVLPTVRQLGDIAQGNSEKFRSLSLAFGQIQSTGRLMGQDLLQLINAGFNPLQIISKKTGESIAQLKERMSEGAISAEEIADAFATATAEGGPFYQGMEKASKTLPGLISTLKDNIVTLGRSFAEIIVPAVTDIVKKLSEFAKKITELDEGTKKAILTFLGIAAAVGPVLLFAGAIVKGFQAMQTMIATIKTLRAAMITLGVSGGPIFLAVAAVAALAVGVGVLVKHQQKLKEQKIAEEYKGMAEAVGLTAKEIRKLGDEFVIFNADNSAGVKDILEIAQEQADATGKTVEEVLKLGAAYDGVNDHVRDLIKQAQEQVHLEKVNAELAESANESRQRQRETQQQNLDLVTQERIERERIADIARQEALRQQEFADGLRRIDALSAAGALSEQDALEKKIQLRQTEIDKIIEAAELGKISADAAASQAAVQRASIERYYARLSVLNEESTTETVDSTLSMYDEINKAAENSRLERAQALQAIQDQKEANHQAELDRIEEEKQARISAAQYAYGQLAAIFSQFYSNELSALKAQKESGKITEQEYATEVAKIQQKQFRLNQATSAINAGIAGAEAFTKALTAGPILGPILAATVAGLTTAQIGFILSQEPPPIPRFADGALTGINKPLTAVVGDNTRYPEVVAPLSPEVFAGIANGIVNALAERAVNSGGNNFQQQNSQYAGGGIQSSGISYPSTLVLDLGNRMLSFSKMVVDDINNGTVRLKVGK